MPDQQLVCACCSQQIYINFPFFQLRYCNIMLPLRGAIPQAKLQILNARMSAIINRPATEAFQCLTVPNRTKGTKATYQNSRSIEGRLNVLNLTVTSLEGTLCFYIYAYRSLTCCLSGSSGNIRNSDICVHTPRYGRKNELGRHKWDERVQLGKSHLVILYASFSWKTLMIAIRIACGSLIFLVLPPYQLQPPKYAFFILVESTPF